MIMVMCCPATKVDVSYRLTLFLSLLLFAVCILAFVVLLLCIPVFAVW